MHLLKLKANNKNVLQCVSYRDILVKIVVHPHIFNLELSLKFLNNNQQV